jgi:hypothetical protein
VCIFHCNNPPCAAAEVLRQQAIAAGAGGTRVPLKRLTATAASAEGAEGANAGSAKGGKGAGRVPKGSVGYEAEDVVSGWTGDGPLKLLLPLRFGETTWMAAAWKVLSEVGAEGLGVTEVRRPGCCQGMGAGVLVVLVAGLLRICWAYGYMMPCTHHVGWTGTVRTVYTVWVHLVLSRQCLASSCSLLLRACFSGLPECKASAIKRSGCDPISLQATRASCQHCATAKFSAAAALQPTCS